MPVHTGKASRSYGTVLLDKGNPNARGPSEAITRKFDVEHYNLTGKIRYLDEQESEESMITFNYCRREEKPCKEVRGCKYIPDGNCGHMSIGQEGVQPTPQQIEEFHTDVEPQPDLSAVKTSNALALELIAKVNQEAVASVQSRIQVYFEQANKAMDELLKTESKIDRLMYEIQADLLKVVERELDIALNGEDR